MDELSSSTAMALSISMIVAAVVVLGMLVAFGCLRRDALADGPRREVGVRWWDLPAALAVMVLGVSGAAGLGSQLFHVDPTAGGVVGGIRAQATWVLLTQVVGQGVVLVYIMWRTAAAERGWRRFGLVPTRPVRDLAAGALGLLAGLPLVLGTLSLMTLLGEWLGMPAPAVGHELLEQVLRSDDAVGLVLMLVAVVAVGPFMEELIFRGVVQTALLSMLGVKWRWAVVVSAALLFTAIHIGASTFEPEAAGGVPWHALPGLAVLGLVLGWLYEKTGSLWPAVLVHAGFNAFNVAMVLVMQRMGWVS